jgi:RNA polymerase sigma-70 factor (family 1)
MNPSPLQHALDFQKGSEKAFEYFFKELYPRLTYYAMRILSDSFTSGCKEEAENAVSDAFANLWVHKHKIDHPLVIKSYLFTSTKNHCIKAIKRKEVRLRAIMELPTIDDSLRERIKADTYGILWAAVSTLPEKCRDIIILYYVGGLNSREIAEKLNLKPSTIKNQLSKGVRALRKKYDITDAEAKANDDKLIDKIRNSFCTIADLSRLYGKQQTSIANIRNNTP